MSFPETVSTQPNSANSASNRFGISLFSELSKQNADNLIFSPFSVAVSLCLLYQGSEGNTRQQLRSVLGEQFVKSSSSQMLGNSSDEKQGYQLKTANALLSSVSVLESYKNKLVSQFGAELFDLKDPESSLKLINEWCSKKTNGMISKILDKSPSPDTLMILLNAIYFKGYWIDPFKAREYIKRKFFGVDKIAENVQFMEREGEYNVVHLKKTNSTMLEFPYKGCEVSFYAIHSNHNMTTTKDIELLPKLLDYFQNNKKSEYALVAIPKFKLDSRFKLVDSIKKLGISDIFGANAQLNGIGSSPLFISEIKQRAIIEFNEKGSEAAAITEPSALGAAPDSIEPPPPPEYIFNRPFLYLIHHSPTGHILFAGRINSF